MPEFIFDLNVNEQALAEEGVTQSELNAFDTCAMKWNLGYNNLLTLRGGWAWSTAVGTAWHAFQQRWRETKGKDKSVFTTVALPKISEDIVRTSEFETKLDYWNNVLSVAQQTYAKAYKGEETIDYEIIEEQLQTEFMGLKLRGMLDLAWGNTIRDFKTTSAAWFLTADGWDIRFQFMFYAWLIRRAKGWKKPIIKFQMDIFQKPILKLGKNETHVAFVNRTKEDIIKRPDFYFRREEFPISPAKMEHWERTILIPKLQTFQLAVDNVCVATNCNTDSCTKYNQLCQFFPICSKPNGVDSIPLFYEQKGNKHTELDGD